MHSTLEHLSPRTEAEIFVLDNGITDGSRERLRKVAFAVSGREIRWIGVPSKRLRDPQADAHFTATTYARVLIPELLPANITRAVYLDGDLLVTDDLSPLFALGLGNAPLAAARDMAIWSTDNKGSGVHDLVEPRPYFNAGVLVIDVTRWRAERFSDRVQAFANAAREPLLYADQDAMNAVVDDWYELDSRWNVQLTMFDHRNVLTDSQRSDLFQRAAVLHFAGGAKPWQPWCTQPGAMRWAQALRRSGWYNTSEWLRWSLTLLRKRAVYTGKVRAKAVLRRSDRPH